MAIDKSMPVLITGCSTGIGRTTAETLARDGWNVYATARRPESIEDLKASGAKTLALDVTDEASMASAVTEVESDGGPVGALVNNAGYSQSGAIESIPMDSVRKQFETNVFGLIRMCQLVLPGMRRAGRGRIVNVSSMGGKLDLPRRRHLPRDQALGRGDLGRPPVRGRRLRRRGGGDRAGPDQDRRSATPPSDSIGETSAEGPYAKFNEEVAKATEGAYSGPFSRLGGGPETVAAKIEKALAARRPSTRYKVTPSASMIMGMRHAMTDRMWDRFVSSQYPQPKA